MNTKQFVLTLVMFATLAICGCTATPSSAGDRSAADAAGERARAEERQSREAAKRALDLRMTEMQHRLDALKKDSRPATDEAKRKLDEQTRTLQADIDRLRAKMSTEEGRAEEWNKLKANTDEALQTMEHKLEELRQAVQK
jgi:chromosome segregation ATPase